jgi:hypothetical protein
MANRHLGKLADVWKHLVLAQFLAADRPQRLYDTHAGHAVYPMEADAERRYGVRSFLDLAPSDATLAGSRYFRILERHRQGSTELAEYPAGPMISMLELGESCDPAGSRRWTSAGRRRTWGRRSSAGTGTTAPISAGGSSTTVVHMEYGGRE